MNIVRKQDSRVKAWEVTDGSKERTLPGYKEEDGASLSVATDSIMITAAIKSHKRSDIATINI